MCGERAASATEQEEKQKSSRVGSIEQNVRIYFDKSFSQTTCRTNKT
jgi:hypothetical protein